MTLSDDLLTLPFGEDAIDRAAIIRRDSARLGALWADSSSRTMFVRATHEVAVTELGELEWEKCTLLGDFPSTRAIFLGLDEHGGALFALLDHDESADQTFSSLRDAALGLRPVDQAAAVQAVALSTWHHRTQFCSSCGSSTEPTAGGHLRVCSSCGQESFPRSDAAVIMLVSDGERCVLGRRIGSPENRWSTLAGFVEAGESPEAAVRREVFEEVGLVVDRLRYRGSQPWPFPASLMLAYEAHAPHQDLTLNEEHLEVRWFEREELRRRLSSKELATPSKLSAGGHLIEEWLCGNERTQRQSVFSTDGLGDTVAE